jgi:DNA-binding transcriptional MocR family regulator
VYQERGLALAKALREECGKSVIVNFPAGGMFLWVEVPAVEDTEDLLDLMVAQKACPHHPIQATHDHVAHCKFS